jgi:hypothetical protein
MIAGLAAFGALACEPVTGRPEGLELRNGVYCLTTDVTSNGIVPFKLYADTTLDCAGHRITDASGTTHAAVMTEGDNIVVKNCIIQGFFYQLQFGTATNYRIEDNQLLDGRGDAILVGGMSPPYGGQGLIAGNIIRSPVPMEEGWSAIEIFLGIADITGNTVLMGKDPNSATYTRYGIGTGEGGVIAHNLVTTVTSPGEGGMAIDVHGPVVVYRNVLVATPGSYRSGYICDYGTGPFVQNLTLGFHPYSNTEANCASSLQMGLKPGPGPRR